MQKNTVNLSIGTYAAEFGFSRDVMRRILADASVGPIGKRSGHPTYRLRDVYLAVIRQQDVDHLNPHARLAHVRAIKIEDEIKTRRGELIEAGDVEREMALLAMHVVRGFDTAVDNLERDVGISAQQAEYLEQHFDECREQLYRDISDEKKGHQGTMRKVKSGSRKNSDGADRGSKSTKRLRQARSGQRRVKKTN